MSSGGFNLGEYESEIAKSALRVFLDHIGSVWATVRVWFSRLRRPPYSESTAKRLVYPILAGHIERAISYRNVDSPNAFIAAVRKKSEQDHDSTIYVLEQTGATFRVLWQSAPVLGFDAADLAVEDVDRDGHHEIVTEYRSTGTGAGSRILMVYSTRLRELYTLTEVLNWQDLAGPISPTVTIDPEGDPLAIRALERAGKKRGFLQAPPTINFDEPRYAIQRWHKENGDKISGRVKIHRYPGPPLYGSSPTIECETGYIRWIGYFKGPLYGYLPKENQHFIAYSPAWFYNWPKCLAYDGERIWFGVHCRNGLMFFRPRDNSLGTVETVGALTLPEVSELRIENGAVLLNAGLRLPLHELRAAPSNSFQRLRPRK